MWRAVEHAERHGEVQLQQSVHHPRHDAVRHGQGELDGHVALDAALDAPDDALPARGGGGLGEVVLVARGVSVRGVVLRGSGAGAVFCFLQGGPAGSGEGGFPGGRLRAPRRGCLRFRCPSRR